VEELLIWQKALLTNAPKTKPLEPEGGSKELSRQHAGGEQARLAENG
jgi:hypothetical protein